MRPRLIAVDDAAAAACWNIRRIASMRPRLIAVDDRLYVASDIRPATSFNEATAYCRG